jgi:hypothetical protein
MDWLMGVLGIGALVLAATLGGAAHVGEIANDCQKMQSFRHGDKVYDCKERSRS